MYSLFLAKKAPELLLGRVRPRRMPLNLSRKLNVARGVERGVKGQKELID
jgi:hypothetical protein